MIITDTTTVSETLTSILAKESMISVDMTDVKQLFGDDSTLRMIKVVGNTVDDVVGKLKADFSELGGCPQKYLAAYISISLRMCDLEILSELTESAGKYKRTLIFETSPDGEIVLYFFFE